MMSSALTHAAVSAATAKTVAARAQKAAPAPSTSWIAAPRRHMAGGAVFPAALPKVGAQISRRSPAVVARASARPQVNAVSTEKISVSDAFAKVRADGRTALIPFLVAGDPDLETTKKALQVLDEEGADIIELGVPYSDPLADGPTIQAAATRALENHVTLEDTLQMVSEVSPSLSAPIVMFTYFNPIMARGAEKFCEDAYAAGARGLLVPDIPLEETPPIRALCDKVGLELVLLTTPTTPAPRASAIAKESNGFVYLVSLTGVTGEKSVMEDRVEGLIQVLKDCTDKPVAVGFGISKPEHALQVKKWGADGVIVGSAFVRSLGEGGSPEEGLKQLRALAKSLKDVLV